jgi:hypothetical protein
MSCAGQPPASGRREFNGFPPDATYQATFDYNGAGNPNSFQPDGPLEFDVGYAFNNTVDGRFCGTFAAGMNSAGEFATDFTPPDDATGCGPFPGGVVTFNSTVLGRCTGIRAMSSDLGVITTTGPTPDGIITVDFPSVTFTNGSSSKVAVWVLEGCPASVSARPR